MKISKPLKINFYPLLITQSIKYKHLGMFSKKTYSFIPITNVQLCIWMFSI